MPADLPHWLHNLLLSLPLWPLGAAVVIGLMLASGRGRAHAHRVAVLGAGVAAVLAIVLGVLVYRGQGGHAATDAAGGHGGHTVVEAAESAAAGVLSAELPPTFTVYRWLSLGAPASAQGHWLNVSFAVDGLTAIMLLFVCVVSLMVVIYACGYMRDHHGHAEPGYERFFAFLGLFVFSMAMLVLSGNFVLLYLGWEAVGLCSYLLIGFYFRKPEAAAAAKKAFIVNRIGDFGFALGIFALYQFVSPLCAAGENPLDYAVVFKYVQAGALSQNELTLVSLLLLCGALGKSAQFPLYTWLPDAMEGPTPVSALIHAATMVTAGIYMVARCGPLFMNAHPIVLDVVLAVGLIGAVLAATMALAQYDMKRILAYSTISQLWAARRRRRRCFTCSRTRSSRPCCS